MALKTQSALGSRVYDLSNFGGCSVFERVRGVNRRKIAGKAAADSSQVVLLQELEFPVSSQCVKVSPDSNFVVATGVYPPEVRIFDVNALGLKCKRGLDFAVTDFTFLEEAFHKTEGMVEFIDHRTSASVALLDLSHFANGTAVTCGAFSPSSLEVCFGLDDGSAWCFDLRSSKPRVQYRHRNFSALRSLQWLSSSATGGVALSGCGSARGQLLASADGVSLRVWSPEVLDETGLKGVPAAKAVATIEAPIVSDSQVESRKGRKTESALRSESDNCPSQQRLVNFNAFSFFPDSGLCLVACEHRAMGVYFLPTVGPAPKWCSMLETITDELEGSRFAAGGAAAATGASEVSVQFVTEEQLHQLGGIHLLGTPLVKRYLHGFLLDSELFRTLKIKRKLPKTNAEFAEKLQKAAQLATDTTQRHLSKKAQRESAAANELLRDSRFEKLFSNPAFELEA